MHLDDARHYLLTTKEKFDAITSDPLDPWVRGAATLYTREFFEVAKAHLNPGGVVTLFVQLYESNDAAVKSEVATFLERSRRHGVREHVNGLGYDLVLLGQVEPKPIDVDRGAGAAARPGECRRSRIARQIGIHSAIDLFGTYAGHSDGHGGWLKRRGDQSRSQPAAAVPGGTRLEPLPERRDLPEHDQGEPVSRRTSSQGRRATLQRAARDRRIEALWEHGNLSSDEPNRRSRVGITPPFGTTMMPPRMY